MRQWERNKERFPLAAVQSIFSHPSQRVFHGQHYNSDCLFCVCVWETEYSVCIHECVYGMRACKGMLISSSSPSCFLYSSYFFPLVIPLIPLLTSSSGFPQTQLPTDCLKLIMHLSLSGCAEKRKLDHGMRSVLNVGWDGINKSWLTSPSWSRGCRVSPSPQIAIYTACLRRTARQAASLGTGTPWLPWVHLIGTEPGQNWGRGEENKRESHGKAGKGEETWEDKRGSRAARRGEWRWIGRRRTGEEREVGKGGGKGEEN